jgi:F-type H+-transporting ATPase subunit delta
MKANRRTKRAARALYRLCFADGVLDQGRARLVAEKLAGSPRRGAIAVLTAFARLVRLEQDRRTVVVESAAPLGPDVRAHLQALLAGPGGTGAAPAFVENPALIAGIRIKVGSDVYDDSVRAKLAELESRL